VVEDEAACAEAAGEDRSDAAEETADEVASWCAMAASARVAAVSLSPSDRERRGCTAAYELGERRRQAVQHGSRGPRHHSMLDTTDEGRLVMSTTRQWEEDSSRETTEARGEGEEDEVAAEAVAEAEAESSMSIELSPAAAAAAAVAVAACVCIMCCALCLCCADVWAAEARIARKGDGWGGASSRSDASPASGIDGDALRSSRSCTLLAGDRRRGRKVAEDEAACAEAAGEDRSDAAEEAADEVASWCAMAASERACPWCPARARGELER
jgi:hypothetical protein